ncbi:MAG: GntR family transcriptional regulator [Hyphococcus sp.]|nr:MAG: GntR family transcriptional regulator [Marinicaulis sp.]
MNQRIEKNSARSQALQLIIEKIHAGDFKDGQRLNETALARELCVSQTPIREALLGLQGQGYLTSTTDKGFYIKPLSIREVEEMYPVLAELERCALKSTAAFEQKTFTELKTINEKFAKARGKRAIALDNAWHNTLLRQCPNLYLLESIQRVRRDIKRYENLYFLEGGNLVSSSSEHDDIISCLEERRIDDACDLIEANCINTIEYIRTWLETRS